MKKAFVCTLLAFFLLFSAACSGGDPATSSGTVPSMKNTDSNVAGTTNSASADPATEHNTQLPYPRTYMESENIEKYDLYGLLLIATNDAFFFEKAEDLSAESIRWYFSYFFDLEHGNESSAWDRWAVREDPEVCVRYFFGENDPAGRSLYNEPTTVYYVPEDVFLSVIRSYLGLDLSGKLETLYPMGHGRFVYLPEKHALATDTPGGFGGELGTIRCISESWDQDILTIVVEEAFAMDNDCYSYYEFKIKAREGAYTILSFVNIYNHFV